MFMLHNHILKIQFENLSSADIKNNENNMDLQKYV